MKYFGLLAIFFILAGCMPKEYVEEKVELDVRAQLELGRSYFKNDQIKEAIYQYKFILEKYKENKPELAWAQYELAYCYYVQKKYTLAKTEFEKVIELYPNESGPVSLAQRMLNQIRLKTKKD